MINNNTIEAIKNYIGLYEGDKAFLKTKTEKLMNNNAIEEFKHILKLIETENKEHNYKKAYNLLMNYWDNFPEEDKKELDVLLKECFL